MYDAIKYILTNIFLNKPKNENNLKLKNPFYTNATMEIIPYANRIFKYLKCSDECFIMAIIYMDRISR